jgi:type I restriction enzyme S subunit
VIPKGWQKNSLSEVAIVQTGIAKGNKKINEPLSLPYLRVANVQDGYLDLQEIKNITISKKDLERYSLRFGDLLLTEGGDFDKLGRGAVWKDQIKPCLHQNHIFVVRVNPKVILSEFLSYLTGSKYGKKYFLSCSKQSTNLASINSNQLKHFPVLLPPLNEQKKIAKILSTWDQAIEKTQKLIQLKEKMIGKTLQTLLGFPSNPQSENWELISLDKLVVKEKGKMVPQNAEKKGVPYIGSISFEGDFEIFTDSPSAVTCSEKDVLILWDGEYAGKVTTGLKGAVSSTVCVLRLNLKIDNQFLFSHLLINQSRIRAIREGSGVPHLPGDFLQWYHIQLPPLSIQRKIGELMRNYKSENKNLIKILYLLKKQKQGLMQKLLTGGWRVPLDQEADHE